MKLKQPTCQHCGSKWIVMHANGNGSYECKQCGSWEHIPEDYKPPKIKPYVKRPYAKLWWKIKQIFNKNK